MILQAEVCDLLCWPITRENMERKGGSTGNSGSQGTANSRDSHSGGTEMLITTLACCVASLHHASSDQQGQTRKESTYALTLQPISGEFSSGFVMAASRLHSIIAPLLLLLCWRSVSLGLLGGEGFSMSAPTGRVVHVPEYTRRKPGSRSLKCT